MGAGHPYLVTEAQLFRSVGLIGQSGSLPKLEEAIETLSEADPGWHLCDVAKLLTTQAATLGKPEWVAKSYERICDTCRR
jgi:hypothetical protein